MGITLQRGSGQEKDAEIYIFANDWPGIVC